MQKFASKTSPKDSKISPKDSEISPKDSGISPIISNGSVSGLRNSSEPGDAEQDFYQQYQESCQGEWLISFIALSKMLERIKKAACPKRVGSFFYFFVV